MPLYPNPEHRLKEYKLMLTDYHKSFWFPWLKRKLHTQMGFCFYLHYNISELFELDNQKPRFFNKKGIEISIPPERLGYWFKPGAIYPRIKCIKKAIKECKKNIRKELQIQITT